MNPLISSSIKDDLIISWHDLVILGVLPADFPRVKINKISTLETAVNKLKEEFKDVVTDSLPPLPMKGRPMVIELDESKDIRPKKITTSKKLPLHWEKDANELVEQLLRDGIIERVADETTDWVSPGFFVPKANGKIRLVTDFTQLNKVIKRPVHPFPSAAEIVQRIPSDAKIFAKLDALQGYHQVPLDVNSRALTTFLLPMGKFRYKSCLLYTSPSPRDKRQSRMPSSA